MLYWIPYAFVRISVFFMAGIVLGIYFPDLVPIRYAAAGFVLLLAVYFGLYVFNRQKKRTVVNPGFTGLLAVLLAGYCNVYFSRDVNRKDHLVHAGSVVQYYSGVVSRFGQEKEKTWKEVVTVQRIFDGARWKEVSGDILVYFSKTDFPEGLRYGDEVLIKGSPVLVNAPGNPREFDYKTFLANKNIYHQHFLHADDAMVVGHAPPSRLLSLSISLRRWADAQLKRFIHGEQERAIASALVLGVTDGLDQELMGAYAATGSLHVLSVSGLHVGILYLLIMLILKPGLKIKHGKWVVAGLSLALLWMYACVTGLSPSVLRAVTMFSFMVIARPLNQRTNIYNVLGASAFLLLLIDPFLLLSVGFQLSFLAVIGIVYLQPLLYNLFEPDNRVVDEVWKITAVSIAAQLATFSLGLLYFHQFPNYFLISNLYVLPLGFVILVGGLAVLAFSFMDVVAQLLGTILEFIISILNYLIFLTESLPFSVVTGIQISAGQCAAIMTLIAAVVLFLQYRRMWMLYAAAFSILVFSVIGWNHYAGEVLPPRLTVYKVPGFSSFDLMESGLVFSFSSPEMPSDKLPFHVEPNRIFRKVRHIHKGEDQAFYRDCSFGRIVSWNGKTILQIRSIPDEITVPVKFDYIVISENALQSMEDLPQTVSSDFVIIDSSNSFRTAERLLRDENRGVNIHSVWHHGAFEKPI